MVSRWQRWIAITLTCFSLALPVTLSLALEPVHRLPHRAPCPAPDLSKYVANLKHVAANWKHRAFKTVDFSFAHANFSQEIPSDEMTQNMSMLGATFGAQKVEVEGRWRGGGGVDKEQLKGRGVS